MTHSFPTRRSSDLGVVPARPAASAHLPSWLAPFGCCRPDQCLHRAFARGWCTHPLRDREHTRALPTRSEEHTFELQSPMRCLYAIIRLIKTNNAYTLFNSYSH